jgi:hypothetical protein
MKHFFWIVSLGISGLVFFVSCKKSDSTPKECTASPSPAQAPSNGTAAYFVNSTNPSAKINSITYQGATGPVTLPSPQLPWNASVFMQTGTMISISAVGSGSGKLTAGYSFNNGTDSVSNFATCGN